MVSKLSATGGILVWFKEHRKWFYPSREQLTEGQSLVLLKDLDDCWVYAARQTDDEGLQETADARSGAQ